MLSGSGNTSGSKAISRRRQCRHSCQQNPSPSPTPAPSLEQRVTDLERRLQAIESIPLVAMALNMKGSAQSSEPSPTPQGNSPIELVNWQYQFKPGQYAILNEHLFSYVLRNRSEKAIKLIEGVITFTDLLGEKLIAIKLIPDLKCAAGGTADRDQHSRLVSLKLPYGTLSGSVLHVASKQYVATLFR